VRGTALTCVCVCVYLTGGPGLLDPCEKDIVDAAGNLTLQQREDLTLAAQVITVNSLICLVTSQNSCKTK